MHVSVGAQAIGEPLWKTKGQRSTTALVMCFALFASGCTVMKQSAKPSATGSTDNSLASVVKLIPINAGTLKGMASDIQEPTNRLRVPVDLANWEYQIGAGDVLSIVVWDHPQLTIPAGPQRTPQEAGNWVSPDGTIFYPHIGILDVAGKTISEVRQAVSRGLRSVIPNPQVDVSIARFSAHKVQVTGAVESPGAVTITNIPLTLMDAVEHREGVLVDGDLQHVKLVRDGTEYTVNLESFLNSGVVDNNPQLRGNDVVVIPHLDNNEVYVLGEVDSPGVVPMNGQPLNLTEALANRSGISKNTADASGIFVFRSVAGNEQITVYQLDITDPTALLLGTRFQLARGDVVYATSAPATRWNRIIANLIPSLSAINTLLLIEDRN